MSAPIPYDYREKGRRDAAEGKRNDRLYTGHQKQNEDYRAGWQEGRRTTETANAGHPIGQNATISATPDSSDAPAPAKPQGHFIVIDDPMGPEATEEQRKAVPEWMQRIPYPFPPPAPQLPRTTLAEYTQRMQEAGKTVTTKPAALANQPSQLQPAPEKPKPPTPPKPAEPKTKEEDRGQLAFF